ncbi:MAG: hypothetical protein PHZ11_00710 [Desulfitobacteriaceae bacterium]|nr:hypothetical protein [Desulfitobacteriaceae bacterium]MDD4345415.1 hypothetical protein [Desulfitobacteriaceae bacterium]MDD4401257.1 hypothetical protein [Desulfitobacteriaceae bacterium]
MVQITNTTNFGQILSSYPQLNKTLQKFGIPFSGCGSKVLLNMTIEQVAERYHVNTASLVQSIQMAIIRTDFNKSDL